MSEFGLTRQCAGISLHRFIRRGGRLEGSTYSCPITSPLPQVCSRAAQDRRSRPLISRRPFTDALRATGYAAAVGGGRRKAESNDGRDDPAGSMAGNALSDFDQRLPTAPHPARAALEYTEYHEAHPFSAGRTEYSHGEAVAALIVAGSCNCAGRGRTATHHCAPGREDPGTVVNRPSRWAVESAHCGFEASGADRQVDAGDDCTDGFAAPEDARL